MGLQEKVASLEEVAAYCRKYRLNGKRVVLTFGAYDIIHLGHVLYLEKARALGDVLIVRVTDDATVRQAKGPERPINKQEDRAMVVAAFESVGHVIIFNEEDCVLIEAFQPDVCVYSQTSKKTMDDRLGQQALVAAQGGEIVCLTEFFERHTSDIIQEIRGSEKR